MQTGILPEAKVSLDSFGKVTIDFNTEFSFPPDMVQKINNFTVPIVVGTNQPFVPSRNQFGFFEIPYLKFTILATDETDPKDLQYTWAATEVTPSKITCQISFASPL